MVDTLETLCAMCLAAIMPGDPVAIVNGVKIHRRCYNDEMARPKLIIRQREAGSGES
jgi:hypothetical protein